MKSLIISISAFLLVAGAVAQEAQPKTQVRVNYLNVCSPSDTDKTEIQAAIERLPAKPAFAVDYEIAHGKSTVTDDAVMAGPRTKVSEGPMPVSNWVRIRKEFPEKSAFSNVQYSFSVADNRAVETLIFRLRDPKELLQVSISNSVTAVKNPAQIVATKTPADRIRIERFGKSSAVLARCQDSNQAAFEPLFQKATSILNLYREILNARHIVPMDLPKSSESTRSMTPKPSAQP